MARSTTDREVETVSRSRDRSDTTTAPDHSGAETDADGGDGGNRTPVQDQLPDIYYTFSR